MNSHKVSVGNYYLVFCFDFNAITDDQVHECVETLKNAFHLITWVLDMERIYKLYSQFLTSRPWLIWRRTLLSMNVWSFSALTTAISKAVSKIWKKKKLYSCHSRIIFCYVEDIDSFSLSKGVFLLWHLEGKHLQKTRCSVGKNCCSCVN